MVVVIQGKYENFIQNVDHHFLNKLLRLVMDANLADFITSRLNTKLSFKDMSFTNTIGLL